MLVAHLYGGLTLHAQEAATGTKQAQAARVSAGAIRIDGRLAETVWQTAQPVTDFIQKEPDEGVPPTDRMEVRFVYDDTALYVGARMFSSGPVQAPLSRRDVGEQVEFIQVELDTYRDRRTACSFGVTTAGVRLNHYHPTDNEGDEDLEHDPVWQARTVIAENAAYVATIPHRLLRSSASCRLHSLIQPRGSGGQDVGDERGSCMDRPVSRTLRPMPIYEYACNGCGHEFESLVRKGSVPSCPACAGKDLERLISLPSVRSETTKQLGLKAAKRRDAAQATERVRAQREYELHHNDH